MLSGCSLNNDSKTDLFQYKNSSVGDNSAVGNIVKELAHNKELNQISLETKKEPYGITLEYKDIDAEKVDKETKEKVGEIARQKSEKVGEKPVSFTVNRWKSAIKKISKPAV